MYMGSLSIAATRSGSLAVNAAAFTLDGASAGAPCGTSTPGACPDLVPPGGSPCAVAIPEGGGVGAAVAGLGASGLGVLHKSARTSALVKVVKLSESNEGRIGC